jgi:hypothetical protein
VIFVSWKFLGCYSHAWREVGHASTSGVWWFRPQNHRRGTRIDYATRERFGGLGLKTIGDGFTDLGLKTREEEQTARGGIGEFASRQSYR